MDKTTKPPRIPKGRPAILFGGVAVVATGFASWWFGLLRHHARKEELDPVTGGSLPTWEYRIQQAQNPVENADKPATLRQNNSSPPPDPPAPGKQGAHPGPTTNKGNSPEHADRAVPGAPQTKSGKSDDPNVGPRPGPEPTPQRTAEEDGRVYTKAPRYVDSYDKKKSP
ncbi:hypothetical protein HYDPIDRAFT_158815 [Hydnomerulius pinastri MD-312]|uniref:Uncharacterized protein n=1 Tax=Hydnomerulius pinastri MD-312 TaxID=994086 RepID=A0A0C9WCS0_9AGAM|nr:hypothetical protein HYDPIDRAFT_158815 [Hydnomerulius pinastri MD-312]